MHDFFCHHFNLALKRHTTLLQKAVLNAVPGKKGRRLADQIADIERAMRYRKKGEK
jgi:hypothetical protein